MPKKISEMTEKTVIVDNDTVPIIDSETSDNALKNKKAKISNIIKNLPTGNLKQDGATGGQALVWSTSESKWKPQTISGSGAFSGNPSDLNQEGAAHQDIIMWNSNSSQWEPSDISQVLSSTRYIVYNPNYAIETDNADYLSALYNSIPTNSLSESNRFTIYLMPGVYDFQRGNLELNKSFIDIIGLTECSINSDFSKKDTGINFGFTSNSQIYYEGIINITTSSVFVYGITAGEIASIPNMQNIVVDSCLTYADYAFNTTTRQPLDALYSHYYNCVGFGSYSFAGECSYYGKIVNCIGKNKYSFIYSGTLQTNGIIENSESNEDSAFCYKSDIKGIIRNCKATGLSFGYNTNACTGKILNCEAAGSYSFLYSASEVNGAIIDNCITYKGDYVFGCVSDIIQNSYFLNNKVIGSGLSYSFGYDSRYLFNNIFFNCYADALSYSFGGASIQNFTTESLNRYTNCIGNKDAFGQRSSMSMNTYENCVAEKRSFGNCAYVENTMFKNCSATGNDAFCSDEDLSSNINIIYCIFDSCKAMQSTPDQTMYAFGTYAVNISSSQFINCSANSVECFATNVTNIQNTKFINCTSGDDSFGYSSARIYPTTQFINCSTTGQFSANVSIYNSGSYINCVQSIGNWNTVSGIATYNCITLGSQSYVKLQNIDSGGATDKQVLTWNNTTSQWVPSQSGGTSSGGSTVYINSTSQSTIDFRTDGTSNYVSGAKVFMQKDTFTDKNYPQVYNSDLFNQLRRAPYYFSDFLSGSVAYGNYYPFTRITAVSSGTAVNSLAFLNSTHIGVLTISSSTTSASGAYVLSNMAGVVCHTGSYFETSMYFPSYLSASSNCARVIYIGLHNATSATVPTNGVYFTVYNALGGLLYVSGSERRAGSQITTPTSTSLSYNTWYRFNVTIFQNQSASFKIYNDNGDSVWTYSIGNNNIPLLNVGVSAGITAIGYSGTANGFAAIDYAGWGVDDKYYRMGIL